MADTEKDATIARLERELAEALKVTPLVHSGGGDPHLLTYADKKWVPLERAQKAERELAEAQTPTLRLKAFEVIDRLKERGEKAEARVKELERLCELKEKTREEAVAIYEDRLEQAEKERDQLRRELSAAHDALGVAADTIEGLRAALERVLALKWEVSVTHRGAGAVAEGWAEANAQARAALSTKEQP